MPSVCRRIVVLLVVALLGVVAPLTVAGSALAQSSGGAGDQQYSDPFGGDDSSGSGSGSKKPKSSSGSGDTDAQPLTQAPQSTGSGGGGSSNGNSSSGSGTAAAPSTSSSTAPAATGQLPNTGLDTRVLILAGVVLLLVGVGLRMRNAPERF